jgi:putative heme iron utilization protein
MMMLTKVRPIILVSRARRGMPSNQAPPCHRSPRPLTSNSVPPRDDTLPLQLQLTQSLTLSTRSTAAGAAALRGGGRYVALPAPRHSPAPPSSRSLVVTPAAAAAGGNNDAATTTTTTKTPNVYVDPTQQQQEEETPEQARMREQVAAFQRHQKEAPRLTPAQEARTLFATARHAVLGTLASSSAASAGAGAGHPSGSVVEYADDGQGGAVLATSTLSPHTADLESDGRVSLTVQAANFASLQDARFSLCGFASAITDPAEVKEAREAFLKKYPDAFYVDFGDFRWFRVSVVSSGGGGGGGEGDAKQKSGGGRLVGGFGRVATIPAADYLSASPDPVAPFTAPVAGHMNADHAADMLAMVQGSVPGASGAKGPVRMTRVDALGCDLAVAGLFGEGQPETRVRLPWAEPANDRKALKDRIVELTKAGRKVAAGGGGGGGGGGRP